MSLSNTQRPGAVVNMTVEEYEARETEEVEGRPVTTIAVASHKTASSGAAVLRLDADLARQLGQWVEHLRPGALPATCPLVFATAEGRGITHLSKRLATLGSKLGFALPKLTSVRKAVVTKAADRPESDRAALAEHMCHSAATARRFYDASQRRKQKSAGYVVSTDIIPCS